LLPALAQLCSKLNSETTEIETNLQNTDRTISESFDIPPKIWLFSEYLKGFARLHCAGIYGLYLKLMRQDLFLILGGTYV